jgi:hypothetical protein
MSKKVVTVDTLNVIKNYIDAQDNEIAQTCYDTVSGIIQDNNDDIDKITTYFNFTETDGDYNSTVIDNINTNIDVAHNRIDAIDSVLEIGVIDGKPVSNKLIEAFDRILSLEEGGLSGGSGPSIGGGGSITVAQLVNMMNNTNVIT